MIIINQQNPIGVSLFGKEVATLSWIEEFSYAEFQYTSDYIKAGLQIAPIQMPLRKEPYLFPQLSRQSYNGLPGLVADSLPDKFGTKVMKAWFSARGEDLSMLNPVQRLNLIGNQGMGALEYSSLEAAPPVKAKQIHLLEMVKVVNQILDSQCDPRSIDQEQLELLYEIGISAGGSRAKAVVYWNQTKGEFYTRPLPGCEAWLIKFDGIGNNRDKESADPQGFGKVEYAYHLIAKECGLQMSPCQLFQENGLSHFMTKRFDRNLDGSKIHMQTLGALTHVDLNELTVYSYEETIAMMKSLEMPKQDLEQLVLLAMFNMIGRNQDDHVKNISFLLDSNGQWRLSPAYDVTYAYDPNGRWTQNHQMKLNGKTNNFTEKDIFCLAAAAGISRKNAKEMLNQVVINFHDWPEISHLVDMDEKINFKICSKLLLDMCAD